MLPLQQDLQRQLFLLALLEDKHILLILLQLLKFKYKINLKIDAYLLCLSFLRDFNSFFFLLSFDIDGV